MSDLESVMAYEAGLAHGQAERTRLETRVAELEAEVKALKPYRYLHPDPAKPSTRSDLVQE